VIAEAKAAMRVTARIGETETALEVTRRAPGRCAVRAGADRPILEASVQGAIVAVRDGGRTVEAVVTGRADAGGGSARALTVAIAGRQYEVVLEDPRRAGGAGAGPRRPGPADVRAVMPGKVVAVLAQAGDTVAAGQGIVVIEAMKMENELPAPRDGRLAAVRVRPGDTVEAGTPLFTIE
jgi:biotin carboxyl carrier protein